ncbi:MAG: hypothetical protein MUF15_07905 [Acidobacteria bacterium]|jgi:hypothetical protein|nr:hypothetical protein [Acidobacteriota bacterium]
MIVEAQKVKNGLFIPLINKFKYINQEKIMIEIEFIDQNQVELEKKHKAGYLKHPVKKDEFSDWEAEQIWVD